jgi:hypothetical protein
LSVAKGLAMIGFTLKWPLAWCKNTSVIFQGDDSLFQEDYVEIGNQEY